MTQRLDALLVLLPLVATGCTVVEDPFHSSLPAAGVQRVVADIEEGDMAIRGSPGTATIELSGRTYGVAGKQDKAAANEAAAGLDVDTVGADLRIDAWSGGGTGSGVDVDLVVPDHVATDLFLENGTASLASLYGVHRVHASRIEADDLGGDLELVADGGGMRLGLTPRPGDRIVVRARGDVDLTLPWGMDYDLQVWGDPAHELMVEDLGFDAVAADVAYFAGIRGSGSIRVDLVVEGGDVTIQDGGWF
ncbi:MAG: hypothetical protein H6742_12050 [Alphaproteobacteria bacterium]|nr:hypothetical protein [Alphaproteobacteria bacterium]